MSLTDVKCKNAKPSEKDYKLTDGGRLYLLVRSTGSKLWRMNYVFAGKQKTLSIGAYPKLSLVEARNARERAKESLAAGVDPMRASTIDPTRAFEAVAKRWFDGRRKRYALQYANRIWARLEDRVFPHIGNRDVAAIEPSEILKLLRLIEAEAKYDTAGRVRQYISHVFKFAGAEGLCKHDPATMVLDAMEAKPPTIHNPALREPDLPEFFVRLRKYRGWNSTKLAIEFIVHTFVRTAEARYATWDEFDGRLWRIPEERMKMGKEHLVPITPHVAGILDELKEMSGGNKYVFPGSIQMKPFSSNSLINAVYAMGYNGEASIHGFRSTASTILNESNLWRPDAIERQLAHVPEDEVRASYNAALYLDERTRMMNWYSDLLVRKASQKPISREELLEGLL